MRFIVVKQVKVKILVFFKEKYRKLGYSFGSSWTERKKNGRKQVVCYAYKDPMKLSEFF